MGSFAGRFGGILYPYINYLSKTDAGGLIGRQLPLVIFGVLSIVGGFLALPLPETRHRPLAKTIDDVEHYAEFCRRHQRRHHSATATDNQRATDTNSGIQDIELNLHDSDWLTGVIFVLHVQVQILVVWNAPNEVKKYLKSLFLTK